MFCGFYSTFVYFVTGHVLNAQNWVAKNPNHFYVGFAATGKQDARILLGSEMDAQKCDQCYEIVLGACRMISPFVHLSFIPLFELFIHASHLKSELALTIQTRVHSIDRRLGQHCIVDSAGQRRGHRARSRLALHAVHGTETRDSRRMRSGLIAPYVWSCPHVPPSQCVIACMLVLSDLLDSTHPGRHHVRALIPIRFADEFTHVFSVYLPAPQLDGKNDDFWICVADQQIVVGRGSFVWKHIILVAELRKFQARDDACSISHPFK